MKIFIGDGNSGWLSGKGVTFNWEKAPDSFLGARNGNILFWFRQELLGYSHM
jgi:hypothetical protein